MSNIQFIPKLFVTILGIATIFSLLQPKTALGAPEPQGFCSNITAYQTSVEKKLGTSKTTLMRISTTQTRALQASVKRRNELVSRNANAWKAIRTKHYNSLLRQAKTDKARAAVEQYKQTIETAVVTQRSTINTTLSSYQTEMEQLLSNSNGGTLALTDSYTTTVLTALTTATNACKQGQLESNIHNIFVNQLGQANQEYLASKQGLNGQTEAIILLTQQHQNTIADAKKEFQVTLQTATRNLESALSQ